MIRTQLKRLLPPVLVFAFVVSSSAQENVMGGANGIAKSGNNIELERLKFYIGDWEYSEIMPKSALHPNGGRNKGRWTAQLGPQGRSIIHAFVSEGDASYEGIEVMAWDSRNKAYRDHSLWYDSPDHVNYVGNFEGDVLMFRSEFELDGKHIRFRMEIRPRVGRGFTLDEFASVNGGREEPTLHGTAIPR